MSPASLARGSALALDDGTRRRSRAELADRVARWARRPSSFEAELPRTPAGKLAVRRLRERYWLGRARRT